MLLHYLAAAGIVFAVNLIPAFGPPTWAVLVLLKLNWHLNAVALVIIGAVCAGAGRLCLALVTRHFRHRLRPERLANLRAAGDSVRSHRVGSVLGLALFALSPVPSAQLFEAAGLLDVPLLPLTASFFVGRLVSYSLYVGGANLAQRSFGSVFEKAVKSPYGIALEIAMLAGIVLLTRIDWAKRLNCDGHTSGRAHTQRAQRAARARARRRPWRS
jgi:membrane protein YqaA with SNARE-associated domain